jgi:hypothetical protein
MCVNKGNNKYSAKPAKGETMKIKIKNYMNIGFLNNVLGIMDS